MDVTKKDIKKISDYLFLSSDPEKADLIFVFGTRFNEPIDISADLYKKGFSKKILVSGGKNEITGKIEADVIAAALKDKDIPEEALILERSSSNTKENVINSAKVLDKMFGLENIHSVLVVAKNYHMRRALMTLKKNFSSSVKYIPIPYSVENISRDNWYLNDDSKQKVLEEFSKIPLYLGKGDLEEL